MASIETLNNIKKDVLKNLSKDKLKHFIMYLTKRYYESYVEGDEETFNKSINMINALIDEYRETYVNLLGFVFFCLYLNANIIITKKCANQDFMLENPFNYDLYEDDEFEEDLHFDIKKIFNKERVKERYYEEEIKKAIE